jgi:hypothetical protein
MTTTPKAQAIRRARHQLRMIQARRREGIGIPPQCATSERLLGFGVCDSIHRTTTSTGRPMPERNAGSVFEVAAWCGALAGGLLLVSSLVF